MADVGLESRVPPHDLHAEASVLSGSMNDRDSFDIAAEILRPEHFYSEAHRRIFEACLGVADAGTDPDIVSVSSWLRERDRFNQVGGFAYMATVLNAAPGLANVRAYAETVHGCWRARQAILICQEYTADGYSGFGKHGSATEYVGSLAEKVYDLTCVDAKTKVVSIKEVVTEVFEDLKKANESGLKIVGLPTGFMRYDKITSGLHDGELTIVAARPGMGKTSLMLDFSLNVAGKPVPREDGWRYGTLIFSLEMPRKQLVQRMLASHARVDLVKLRTATLSIPDWSKVTRSAAALADAPIFIDDEPAISVVMLRSKARRKIAEEKKHKVKIALVAADYIQLMGSAGDDKDQNREREVASFSRGLKQLSKELSVPVVALSQLNRAVESRADKRPMLSDLRESGAIEQDADNVVFIYRDDYYNKNSEDRNVAELIISKQRNGPTDTVRVRFDPQYTRFDNLADDEYDDAPVSPAGPPPEDDDIPLLPPPGEYR
jgi:replicative DNA helicase